MDGAALPDDRLSALAEGFVRCAAHGLPKHAQLRGAILQAIRNGLFKPGDKVPPEQSITRAVGISLGTVQKTLSGLASEGVLVRSHGRGTFVAERRGIVSDLWHIRFVDEAGKLLLPIYTKLLGRSVVRGEARVTNFLGADEQGLIRILRLVTAGAKVRCYSQFFVRAERFGNLLTIPGRELENVNLKHIMVERFGAPTLSVVQMARASGFSKTVCRALSLPEGSSGMVLEIEARTLGEEPLSFQRLWVPATEYLLDLTLQGLPPGLSASSLLPAAGRPDDSHPA
jgi:GntR family transcriptional regulator